MRRAARSDANQQQIVDELRAHYGDKIDVHDTHAIGSGYPDICCGIGGVNLLFEIKTASGRMTKDELTFMRKWRGQYRVIRSTDQAICAIERAIKR